MTVPTYVSCKRRNQLVTKQNKDKQVYFQMVLFCFFVFLISLEVGSQQLDWKATTQMSFNQSFANIRFYLNVTQSCSNLCRIMESMRMKGSVDGEEVKKFPFSYPL